MVLTALGVLASYRILRAAGHIRPLAITFAAAAITFGSLFVVSTLVGYTISLVSTVTGANDASRAMSPALIVAVVVAGVVGVVAVVAACGALVWWGMAHVMRPAADHPAAQSRRFR